MRMKIKIYKYLMNYTKVIENQIVNINFSNLPSTDMITNQMVDINLSNTPSTDMNLPSTDDEYYDYNNSTLLSTDLPTSDNNMSKYYIVDTNTSQVYDIETFHKKKSFFYKIFCCFLN